MSAIRTLMYPTTEIWFMFVVVVLLLFGVFVVLCVVCSRLRKTRDQTKMINENLGRTNEVLASKVAQTLSDRSMESQSQPEPDVMSREDQNTEDLEPATEGKVQSPYERFAEKKEAETNEYRVAQSPMDRRAERYRKKTAK